MYTIIVQDDVKTGIKAHAWALNSQHCITWLKCSKFSWVTY